jgi:hypothetical protein
VKRGGHVSYPKNTTIKMPVVVTNATGLKRIYQALLCLEFTETSRIVRKRGFSLLRARAIFAGEVIP